MRRATSLAEETSLQAQAVGTFEPLIDDDTTDDRRLWCCGQVAMTVLAHERGRLNALCAERADLLHRLASSHTAGEEHQPRQSGPEQGSEDDASRLGVPAVDTELDCGKVARFNVTACSLKEMAQYGSLGLGQAHGVDGTHQRQP